MEKDIFVNSKASNLLLLSLFISILICVIKFLAYFITKSVAIYSDAIESIINIISATIAFIGTKIALKPPDEEHPYGHTKVEYLFSILEAIFILGAAISIFKEAYAKFIVSHSISNLKEGTFLVFLTILLNGFISFLLYKQGKKENAPILIAHASHIFTDILTTGGVILGILIAKLFNFWILDPIIAIIISINILYIGYKIIKDSVNSLLDISLPIKDIESIKNIIEETIKNFPTNYKIFGIHDFKTRKAGRKGFVEFHLVVQDEMSVKMAHELCDEIERKIKEKHPEISVIIHIEAKEERKN
ncbi:cation diffusion facilitator family transporter [Thermodesulfobacterium hydrogeniphilum]|uniref:cation diffusion facilitator family transporter n=1 Tax=Thermodesulfobacterium hydrogeniphilum TaxID=161156 RepID=UPI00068EA20C|nr:cation diffusion facilitator family transporter [Thermodesulfobacterium hydrogeniphilum]